jgi:flagellar hook-associated protein 3 FlgL
MRVTSETMVLRSLDRLQTRLTAYERTQSELGTGRRILAPSDDPAGTRRAMSLTNAMRSREQELANASDAMGWLDSADRHLQTASGRLTRALELALRGASDAGQGERTALAAELRQIAEEMAGIANAKHLDRPLFGGYTGGPAVVHDGTQWVSNGDGDVVTRRVSDTELVRVNLTASEWLGFGVPGQRDLLTLLEDVATAVEAGAAPTNAQLDALRGASARIGDHLGIVGAATNRVESARSRAEDLLLTLRTELSEVQDVDIARGVMELQVQQVAYEATLQALAKALPPSLVAFLR